MVVTTGGAVVGSLSQQAAGVGLDEYQGEERVAHLHVPRHLDY